MKPLVAAALLLLISTSARADTPVRHFNVRDSGALGDGTTKDTSAIQKAIDAAANAGGGEVDLPAGTYLTGSLELKSGVNLNLEASATIQGSPDPDDYPLVTARWEGIELPCHEALISARDAHDIAITGSGTIEGNPLVTVLRDPRGPTLVEPIACTNVRVDGVTLKSRRMWTLHPTYCQDVTIANLTIVSTGGNSDGIDPDSCRHVLIDHCAISSGDDDIAIKSGKGQEGVTVARACEDITITNCTFLKGFSSIALGSELSGGIRHVVVRNCSFERGLAALYLKSRPGRGGYVQDVEADHLTVNSEPLLILDTAYAPNPDSQGVPGVDGLTSFNDIVISDVTVNSTSLVKVDATAEKPLDGLSLTNITGKCGQGMTLRNAKNVVLRQVKVKVAHGPGLMTENAQGTGLDGAVPLAPPAGAD